MIQKVMEADLHTPEAVDVAPEQSSFSWRYKNLSLAALELVAKKPRYGAGLVLQQKFFFPSLS